MTTLPVDRRDRSAVWLAGWSGLVAVALTAAVVVLPPGWFDVRAPSLRIVLETVSSVIALLVGYLVYGRFRQDRRLQDLLLTTALWTVAVASLVLAAVPSAISLAGADRLSSWAPLTVRLLGAVVLGAAALTPTGYQVDRRRGRLVALGFIATVLLVAAAGLLWGELLPPAVAPVPAVDGGRPMLQAHPAVLAAQGAGAALYGIAAVCFARQADRRGDQLLRWLAAGCVLSSAARVHYLLYPSLYSDYVSSGDVLRLGFYVFLLVGAAREITSYWEARARAAVLEDRRRMAHDLHDGVIQELSYILAQSRRLSSRPGDRVAVERIGGAAGRAIDESRRALAALTRAGPAPVAAVLQEAAEEMASRYEVTIVTDLDDAAQADGPLVETLLRVTGEAVRNAVRHGSATRIDIRLTADPPALVVSDDGCGFPAELPDGGRAGAFGLRTMRERAARVGGTLTVRSEPGEGTTVRMSWV